MEEKWIVWSRTAWGAVIMFVTAVLPVVGPVLGINLTAADLAGLGDSGTNLINAVGAFGGAVLTLVGILKRKTTVSITPPV